jgi:hypothetical protein
MKALKKLVPIRDCLDLFPDLADRLPSINQALRNINLGKMDYLPYEESQPGYGLSMRTDLIPQGAGRPPAMGKWQLEVVREDTSYRLLLQGKAQEGEEWAEIVFPCGADATSVRFGFSDASLDS